MKPALTRAGTCRV